MDFGTFGGWHQTRRLSVYLAFAVALVTLYYCVVLDGPILLTMLLSLYIAVALARLLRNPGRGFRFTRSGIQWADRHQSGAAPIEALSSVAVGAAPDGQTICVLTLSDGRRVRLTGLDDVHPALLMREFGKRGIRVWTGADV